MNFFLPRAKKIMPISLPFLILIVLAAPFLWMRLVFPYFCCFVPDTMTADHHQHAPSQLTSPFVFSFVITLFFLFFWVLFCCIRQSFGC